MENTVRAMMGLIANEVCGSAIDKKEYSFSQEELVKLYKLSKTHDLAHLVGDALIKNDLLSDAEIRAKFEKQIMVAVLRYEKINYELECLRETLNEAKIPFIPLKGSVIRQYYPEPWMRTSCDIDILVHESDLEAATSAVVEKLSYEEEGKGSHDIGLFSPGGVHLELHYSLIESDIIGKADRMLEPVWEQVSPTEKYPYDYEMTDALYYYYHIAHMAKHFQNGGCGAPVSRHLGAGALRAARRRKAQRTVAGGRTSDLCDRGGKSVRHMVCRSRLYRHRTADGKLYSVWRRVRKRQQPGIGPAGKTGWKGALCALPHLASVSCYEALLSFFGRQTVVASVL